MILEKEVGLARSSLKTISSGSFKPISDFFKEENEAFLAHRRLARLTQRLAIFFFFA